MMGPNPGELVIDDGNFNQFISPRVDGEMRYCSALPRPDDVGYNSRDFTAAFTEIEVPRSDYSARIKELKETRSLNSDLWRDQKIQTLNQGSTNYCWAHGPVSAAQLVRARAGMPAEYLSATSIAAIIKGYKNQGGWGGDALEFMVAKGITTVSKWPINAIKREYDTPAMRADMATRKVTEWVELKPRNFGQLMTALLLGLPVAVGYNWWSHEVCALDPVEIESGSYGIRIVNSWGEGWSDKGMGLLVESKAKADDAVIPRVVSLGI